MKQEIKLVALDLDGTLYNSNGVISEGNRETLKAIIDRGVTVVISTGRPYVGLPLTDMKEIGIDYAITANGAGVYRIRDRFCLHEDAISTEDSVALLRRLHQLPVHIDAFIDGNAYTQESTRQYIPLLHVPESLRSYIRDTRTVVENLADFVAENSLTIQKLTINFVPDAAGNLTFREKTAALLDQYPQFHYVSGGFRNIEVNKTGVSKAKGLRFLCETLHIPLSQTMACGDSENDFDIVSAAGIGVAMANAEPILLDCADFVSRSNEEDGVAYAIKHFISSSSPTNHQ